MIDEMNCYRRVNETFFLKLALCLGLVCLCLSVPVFSETIDQSYSRVRNEYQSAIALPEGDRKVDALRKCAQDLQQLIRTDSQGKLADKSQYLVAQTYHRLYDITQSRNDFAQAVEQYRKVVEKYRQSPLADDAQYLIGTLYMPDDPARAYLEFKKVSLFFPKGDMALKAAQQASKLEDRLGCKGAKPTLTRKEASRAAHAQASSSAASPACPSFAELNRIQHWSGSDYSRIVIYTTGPVSFEEHPTPVDPKATKPAQISLDLNNCTLSPKLGKSIRVTDRLLEAVHVKTKNPGHVIVSLEAKSIEKYRVFTIPDPFRVIVDVRGKGSEQRSTAKQDKALETKSLPSLARQLSLDVKRILIDPGHGGKDKGAVGPNGVYEKDIVLSIAKELKKILENDLKREVFLTRSTDRFVPLEERTAMANARKVDLFISIHTHAHTDRSICGTETYSLNLSRDKESARVAAAENATSDKSISDFEAILHDLLLNTKIRESVQLATEVQKNAVKQLRERGYDSVRDLGVKQAPFCVLVGAEMPSILIETAFITNDQEEKQLKDKEFRASLARGIASGVKSYIQQIKGLGLAGDRS